MRPRRLEVEGFSAFRRPVVVDFAEADLFALVGPTGAGKTSVIDAITFALYGTVPRLDDRRAVAPVVSQNLTEARVRLDFTVGADEYSAVRVVRASKSGATTKEARLEQGDQVLAGTADEVGTAVSQLLGLTYEHFTTCVSLPQGQFARFLHDKPRDRQDLLVRLLELGLYDQVASLARQRAGLAAGRADVRSGQLERLARSTPEARDEAQAQVACLAALAEQLVEARPELDALADRAMAARRQAERCEQQLAGMGDLQVPTGVTELAGALSAAVTERAARLAAEEATAAAVAEAEERLATLPSRADLEGRRRDQTRRADLVALADKGRQALDDVVELVERCSRAEAQADAEHQQCTKRLEHLRVHQRAQALVRDLRPGEPCPVCRQVVSVAPNIETPDLAGAEQSVAQAGQRLKNAGRALADARTEQARVEEKLARVAADLAEVTERLDQTAELAPVLATARAKTGASSGVSADLADVVDAQLAEVVAAEAARDQARNTDQAARGARAAADRQHDRLLAREAEARRVFESARDAVAGLEPPRAERVDLAADWMALVAWADERRPALAAELAALQQEVDEAERRAADRREALVEACRAVGVDPGPAYVWPGEAVAAARARAEEAVQRLAADLVEAERLRDDVRLATEERQVAETLALHLAANRFEKWLLDEAIDRLVVGASGILDDLTGGAYALAVDPRHGSFTVIDHVNASQPRPARTLSGGETFLASLALALALADQVAELSAGGVARLEALFLDEGFGTLDPDTLDVVAGALDELGARGRMVGVVTHVRELAERLPVRFEVQKVGGTATIERVET